MLNACSVFERTWSEGRNVRCVKIGVRPNRVPQFTGTKEESVWDFLKKVDFVGEGENPVWADNQGKEAAIPKLGVFARQWYWGKDFL